MNRPWDGRTREVLKVERRRSDADKNTRLYLTLECGHTVLNPHGQHLYGDAICWDCPEPVLTTPKVIYDPRSHGR